MAKSLSFPARPNLDMLKKLAKQRHKLLRAQNPKSKQKLAAAQLEIAREYGFSSWRDLHAHITALNAAAPASAQSPDSFLQLVQSSTPEKISAALDANPALINVVGKHPQWGGRPQPLHVSIERGDPKIFSLLLTRGANSRGDNAEYAHWSPLMLAIHWKRPQMIKTLLKLAAPIELLPALMLPDDRRALALLKSGLPTDPIPAGSTLLHFARSPKPAARLLDLGANLEAPDNNNRTALESAAAGGHKKIAAFLLARGAKASLATLVRLGDLKLLASQLPPGAPAPDLVMAAAENAPLNVVRFLLKRGADVNSANENGVTPLHSAAWQGNLALAKLLVASGARLDARDKEHDATPQGWAIHAAENLARYACLEVAAYLESAAERKWSVEKLPERRKTHKITQWKPIMDAAFEGDAATIKKLLAAGADPNILSTTPARYRPLHRAIEKKITAPRTAAHERAVAALLAGGADPKLRGCYSRLTALTLAALDETRFIPLLRKYFEPLDIFNAAILAEEEIVAALLKKNPALAKSPDESGWTPLHHAASSNLFADSPTHAKSLVNIAKLLLDNGASLTATWNYSSGGWPIPVLFGCTGAHDFPQMAQLLLQNGANPCDNESVYHAADEGHTHALALIEKYTPAKHLAEECTNCLVPQLHWGRTRGLPWLLSHGGNPNTVTKRFGTNALHEAAARGASAETIALLIKHGANPNTKTAAGKNAYQLAKNSQTLAALKRS